MFQASHWLARLTSEPGTPLGRRAVERGTTCGDNSGNDPGEEDARLLLYREHAWKAMLGCGRTKKSDEQVKMQSWPKWTPFLGETCCG
jgi:hypothetical protein